jgi:hypothetical protein
MNRLVLLALCLFGAAALRADDPATFPVGSLTFKRPTDWSWVELTNTAMRKAQLKIPGAKADESAEVAFFYFGPQGGGDVQANAQRWVGQFHGNENAAKVETQEIGGAKVTIVTTEGTYVNAMVPGPDKPNYALLGAIIEQADGNVFVKMTGPAALVKDSRKKFLDFIATAFPAK